MRLTRKRVLLLLLGIVVLMAGVGLLGGGWYYADELREGALEIEREKPSLDLEVAALEEGAVTLRVTPLAKEDGPWTKEGAWGLEWDSGYGRIGEIIAINEQQVVRTFRPAVGSLKIGDLVRLDSYVYLGDPQEALDLAFQEVSFSSPLGNFPAWFVKGSSDTWAIFVHGKDATRREALRLLPTVTKLGLPSLVITYRNDEGTPVSRDGFHRYGKTEWKDLERAAEYALEHGANDLILVGYSMGGAIVVNFLYQSPLAKRVKGVILDAPMLDFGATVDLGARRRGAPWPLVAVGKFIAGLRFDINWGELDYLRGVHKLAVPVLLFHGDADTKVPIETSDALAKARPDLVTYARVPGATHGRSWNMDPAGYEVKVADFLKPLTR